LSSKFRRVVPERATVLVRLSQLVRGKRLVQTSRPRPVAMREHAYQLGSRPGERSRALSLDGELRLPS